MAAENQTPSRVKALLAIDNRSPWAIALLNEGLFSIEQTVCLDGKTFLLGPVLTDGCYLYVISLVDSGDGRFIPRLFYKSLSQGSWRCPPYIETVIKKGGKTKSSFYKGDEMTNWSYTQTTRVTRQLSLVLDTQEQKEKHKKVPENKIKKYFYEDNFTDLFNDPDFQYNKVLTFTEETECFDFQEHGFDADPFEYCKEIDKLVRKRREKKLKKNEDETTDDCVHGLLNEYMDLKCDAVVNPEKKLYEISINIRINHMLMNC